MSNETRYRREIVHFGRLLHERGYVAAMDGNLSMRLAGGRILSTPTGMSKGALRASDLVIVDLEGRIVAGRHPVSSEIAMHLLIYRLRADIGGIVHAHPPTATGFAAAGLALDQPLACEMVIGLGSIPLARYGTPGTPELSETLRPLVSQYDAILMSNHGVVTYGDTLEHAYMKMETVEHFAQITLVTHILGRQQPIEEKALDKLLLARSRYKGINTAAPLPPASRSGSSNGNHLARAATGERLRPSGVKGGVRGRQRTEA
ncbi:MAG TPA: class II aldolase/adducin family protein [Terriglobales bacterium]|nr:class II aldolase/adducin family protein [Terriglobales bacterium]